MPPSHVRVQVLQFNMQFGQNWNDANPDVGADQPRSDDRRDPQSRCGHRAPAGSRTGRARRRAARSAAELHALARRARRATTAFFSYPKADPRELPFGIGLAILAKTPLRDTVRRDLPSPAVEFDFQGESRTPTDRLLIGAKTVIAGRELQLFNTHLLAFFMLNATSEEHISQRQFVVDQLRAATGPTLFGGDFNVSNHGSLVQQFSRPAIRPCRPARSPGAAGPMCSTTSFTTAICGRWAMR